MMRSITCRFRRRNFLAMMMVRAIATLPLLMLATYACADGFSPLPLRRVLLETDAIILVEILENKGTTTHRNKGQGSFKESVIYTNDIKARVISTHLGKFTGAEYETKYSLTFVKGVWLVIPGSGLEQRMMPGEKYVLMLRNVDGSHTLQRAEKAEKLELVMQLRKELDDEDTRVAEAQAKIPNGIYHYADADVAKARKVRLQDGRRVQIGEQCDFDIVGKELHSRYNEIQLSLTLGPGKPGHCVLIVDGKAYWLFDHNGAAKGTKQAPRLYCFFTDRKNAEAVGEFFGIAIADAQAPAVEQPEKADPAAADVSMIAAWIVGANKLAPFKNPFDDQHFFTDADDAQFYTDVQGVDVPDKLKRVSYDFIKARMDLIRNGHKRDPAVLITRSVLNEPGTVREGKQSLQRKQEPGERVYYIEVAIGNLAWHGMKILVYEDDGPKKIKILSSEVS